MEKNKIHFLWSSNMNSRPLKSRKLSWRSWDMNSRSCKKPITFLKFTLGLSMVAIVLTGCSILPKKNLPIIDQPAPGDLTSTTTTGSLLEKINEQTKISKFSSLAELKDFLAKANTSGNSASFGGGMMLNSLPQGAVSKSALAEVAPTAAVSDSALAGLAPESGTKTSATDFSKTNTQVAGVDEADLIKTDGQYIYALAGKKLYIIEANPAKTAKILSKIELTDAPQNLYVNGNSLAVFGQAYNINIASSLATSSVIDETGSKNTGLSLRQMPIRSSEFTYFKVYDLSNKAQPKLVRDLAFEGNYVDSRMIGDYVYFISSKYSYDFGGPSPMPLVMKNGKIMADAAMPSVYYFGLPYESYNFTKISSINIKDNNLDENSQTYLLSGTQNLYVSEKNIYITYTKYLDENQLMMETARALALPKLSSADQVLVGKIDQADGAVLSDQEKATKVFALISRYLFTLSDADRNQFEADLDAAVKQKYQDIAKELEKTVIHKIAIDKDKIEYKTFGEVTGQVLNQYSMDEQDGNFRIATTKNQTWSRFVDQDQAKSYNNLYVLDENLKVVGSLENLAAGEKIYSARFMGKRAYLVTFKQTDPLFVIDLSLPTAPKVLGQLKIPGFSSYLHPYDDNTLIGLGKETSVNQYGSTVTGGLKLSLFDVSQVDQPKELDSLVVGSMGSDSIALSDPKAFLFSKEKNLLVIPATLTKSVNKNEYGKFYFGGALVFKIDGKTIELRGKIDHSDGGQAGQAEKGWGYQFYDNSVRRSLFIEDNLFTYSNKYLKINQLLDLKELNKLKFDSETAAIEPMDGVIGGVTPPVFQPRNFVPINAVNDGTVAY